jgi:diacylglycerol O-acyltransferase
MPVAFLPQNHAVAIAIMSYNGSVDFGLLADYDAMPDVREMGDAIRASLDELLDAARDEAGGPSRSPDTAGAPVHT